MVQLDTGTLITVASLVVIINGGAIGMLWKMLNRKQEKENCAEIVKRQDERHAEIRDDLKEIKRLIIIRNGKGE